MGEQGNGSTPTTEREINRHTINTKQQIVHIIWLINYIIYRCWTSLSYITFWLNFFRTLSVN